MNDITQKDDSNGYSNFFILPIFTNVIILSYLGKDINQHKNIHVKDWRKNVYSLFG